MIAGARSGRVWVCATATDLRLGYDGLVHIVARRFNKHILDGDLFVFTNRRRTSVKVLLWDGTGLCIFAKRLAKGTFPKVVERAGEAVIVMTQAELGLFLQGAAQIGRLAGKR